MFIGSMIDYQLAPTILILHDSAKEINIEIQD